MEVYEAATVNSIIIDTTALGISAALIVYGLSIFNFRPGFLCLLLFALNVSLFLAVLTFILYYVTAGRAQAIMNMLSFDFSSLCVFLASVQLLKRHQILLGGKNGRFYIEFYVELALVVLQGCCFIVCLVLFCIDDPLLIDAISYEIAVNFFYSTTIVLAIQDLLNSIVVGYYLISHFTGTSLRTERLFVVRRVVSLFVSVVAEGASAVLVWVSVPYNLDVTTLALTVAYYSYTFFFHDLRNAVRGGTSSHSSPAQTTDVKKSETSSHSTASPSLPSAA